MPREIDGKVCVAGGAGHNPDVLYQKISSELMDFHSGVFIIPK